MADWTTDEKKEALDALWDGFYALSIARPKRNARPAVRERFSETLKRIYVFLKLHEEEWQPRVSPPRLSEPETLCGRSGDGRAKSGCRGPSDACASTLPHPQPPD